MTIIKRLSGLEILVLYKYLYNNDVSLTNKGSGYFKVAAAEIKLMKLGFLKSKTDIKDTNIHGVDFEITKEGRKFLAKLDNLSELILCEL